MMGPTRCRETSVNFSSLTPRNNPETSRPQPKFSYHNTVVVAACLLHMWDLSLFQRCCWRFGFHGTSLCVEWWLFSRRFETSINCTSQYGVTSQKTCISMSKICPKVISNFVRILRCSYSSRVFAYLTRGWWRHELYIVSGTRRT